MVKKEEAGLMILNSRFQGMGTFMRMPIHTFFISPLPQVDLSCWNGRSHLWAGPVLGLLDDAPKGLSPLIEAIFARVPHPPICIPPQRTHRPLGDEEEEDESLARREWRTQRYRGRKVHSLEKNNTTSQKSGKLKSWVGRRHNDD